MKHLRNNPICWVTDEANFRRNFWKRAELFVVIPIITLHGGESFIMLEVTGLAAMVLDVIGNREHKLLEHC